MREIKFEFIYKTANGFSKKKYYLSEFIRKSLEQLCDLHFQCELVAKRQYTGLKDKNGVEIYEGDIVSIYSEVAKTHTIGGIFYNEKVCAFMIDDGIFKQYLPITAEDDLDIKGNIYENPELLENNNETI